MKYDVTHTINTMQLTKHSYLILLPKNARLCVRYPILWTNLDESVDETSARASVSGYCQQRHALD